MKSEKGREKGQGEVVRRGGESVGEWWMVVGSKWRDAVKGGDGSSSPGCQGAAGGILCTYLAPTVCCPRKGPCMRVNRRRSECDGRVRVFDQGNAIDAVVKSRRARHIEENENESKQAPGRGKVCEGKAQQDGGTD